MTAGVLAAGIFAGRKMFKNFVAADSEVRKYVNNETAEIEKESRHCNVPSLVWASTLVEVCLGAGSMLYIEDTIPLCSLVPTIYHICEEFAKSCVHRFCWIISGVLATSQSLVLCITLTETEPGILTMLPLQKSHR